MTDMSKIKRQAQDLQEKLKDLQDSFKYLKVTAKCDDDLVILDLTCDGVVHETTISDELLTLNKKIVEKYITEAINNGREAIDHQIKLKTKIMMADSGFRNDSLLDGSNKPEAGEPNKTHH